MKNFLKQHGITAENGYVSHSIFVDNISERVHYATPIHIGLKDDLYKIPEYNIYVHIDKINTLYFMYFKPSEYDNKQITEIREKCLTSHKRTSYFQYNSSCNIFMRLKTIENNDKLDDNIETLVDKVASKIKSNKKIGVNIVLQGKPGTGKSSCVEIISQKMKSDVYILGINKDMKEFVENISILNRVIVLIPELDKHIERCDPEYKEYEQLLLELLCGCYTPTNSLIIITCNDINKLRSNPIMTRPGRVHFTVEFSMINKEMIKKIVLEYFPDFKDFSIFDKFVNNVSVAEFKTAITNKFIMDEVIDKSFKVEKMEYTNKMINKLYM